VKFQVHDKVIVNFEAFIAAHVPIYDHKKPIAWLYVVHTPQGFLVLPEDVLSVPPLPVTRSTIPPTKPL
jgi:hypothetical protein